jgi:hypothetical protein
MMAGGIGFFTGAALWEVAFGEHGARTWSVWRQITFVPATIVVVWISLRLLHPFYERVYVGAQSPPHRSAEFQSGIILLAVLGGVLETLLHTALWEGETVGWGQLVGGLVYGAAITGAWIRGLRPGSLIRSMLIAVSFGLFLWLYQPSEHLLRKSMPAAPEGGPP